jgi:transcriptional regulator GlxA family with amidase domain
MSTPAKERKTRRLAVTSGTELVVRATGQDLVVIIEGDDGELELVRSPAEARVTVPPSLPRDLRVERALAAARAQPDRRFSVSELAKIAGASRATFVRSFTRSVGVTPSVWLAAQRLELARTLLVETDAGLAELASRTGYASEFSLSRAFKRRFGVAPGVLRRATRKAALAIRCAA